ncbi:hypothetical protein ACLOJK_014695 [Asimina triloba]
METKRLLSTKMVETGSSDLNSGRLFGKEELPNFEEVLFEEMAMGFMASSHWGRGGKIDTTVAAFIVMALLIQCNSGKIRIRTSQSCFLLGWICRSDACR